MTKEERHLWYDFLKNYPVQFYRQKVIGSYIVDFYCHRAKLIVELDGSQHFEDIGCKNDTFRTIYLNNLGLDIMRIPNNEIWNNFPGVCEAIDQMVQERASPHQSAGSRQLPPGEAFPYRAGVIIMNAIYTLVRIC